MTQRDPRNNNCEPEQKCNDVSLIFTIHLWWKVYECRAEIYPRSPKFLTQNCKRSRPREIYDSAGIRVGRPERVSPVWLFPEAESAALLSIWASCRRWLLLVCCGHSTIYPPCRAEVTSAAGGLGGITIRQLALRLSGGSLLTL